MVQVVTVLTEKERLRTMNNVLKSKVTFLCVPQSNDWRFI